MNRLWILAIGLLMMPGCSDKPFDEKIASKGRVDIAPSTPTLGLSSSSPTSRGLTSPAATSKIPERRAQTVTSSPNPKDTIPVTLELTPGCAERGAAMTASIRAAAHSGLSMAVGYSDSQAHGNYGFGDTDENGLFVWHWVVPADAPLGEAGLLVAAGSADGKKGGSNHVEFVVARRC